MTAAHGCHLGRLVPALILGAAPREVSPALYMVVDNLCRASIAVCLALIASELKSQGGRGSELQGEAVDYSR